MRAQTINKEFFKNKAHMPKLKNWECAFNYCSKENNKIITNQKFQEPVKIISDNILFDWQKEIISILESPPDDRNIYWYYGKQGIGKTQFIKYCVVKFGAIILNGKPSDMKNGIIEYQKKMVYYLKLYFLILV